jgi:hypothetical protein
MISSVQLRMEAKLYPRVIESSVVSAIGGFIGCSRGKPLNPPTAFYS